MVPPCSLGGHHLLPWEAAFRAGRSVQEIRTRPGNQQRRARAGQGGPTDPCALLTSEEGVAGGLSNRKGRGTRPPPVVGRTGRVRVSSDQRAFSLMPGSIPSAESETSRAFIVGMAHQPAGPWRSLPRPIGAGESNGGGVTGPVARVPAARRASRRSVSYRVWSRVGTTPAEKRPGRVRGWARKERV